MLLKLTGVCEFDSLPAFHKNSCAKRQYAVSILYGVQVFYLSLLAVITFPKMCSMGINWCYLKIIFCS